ncbi:MAG: twin-arginine translocase TatA/TatE family subunit [Kiritimatiellia bacterium]|nr:twin-arginine translocase TatA/TatE family subunit [Kiritimatiellia bacterium]
MILGFMAGPWQIVICIIVIALLFGGKKIPELARALGKAKGEFSKGLKEGEKEDELPSKEEPKQVEA